jgi:nucleoside-diphosphate-sugar epimerase
VDAVRVVVSGHRGFIGHHVVAKLLDAGHRVTGLDRNETPPVEIADMVADDIPKDTEAVIHCAAHADVRSNWGMGQMSKLRNDNEAALHAILECASVAESVRSFVFVSTGAVYADQLSPYAASKLAGEAWCKAYAAKFGWRLSIVRPAACFGSGYHHGHVADFVRMARETGRVTSLTAGYKRDACHVEGLAQWLVMQATHPEHHKAISYMRNTEGWGCRDTAELMGVPAEWTSAYRGWLGDCSEPHAGDEDAVTEGFSIRAGVEDALRSLGWER